MSSPAPGPIRFGTFEVDPRAGELRKGGAKVRLQEKPLQVLLQLLAKPGELVTRDELREALWSSDTFVDFDHSLGTAVAKLRTALGDSARSPRFIETVGGRGYRFIAPVSATVVERPGRLEGPSPGRPEGSSPGRPEGPSPGRPEGPSPGRPEGRPLHSEGEHPTAVEADLQVGPPEPPIRNRGFRIVASLVGGLLVGSAIIWIVLAFDVAGARAWLRRESSAPIQSIAVLPLMNLSGDPSQDYFVDGMTEQLIATLAQLPGVQVISRTSAMHYKGTTLSLPEIGHELKADAVIEGSVVRAGNRVRITAQLVDARSDQHLWAQSYERDFADVLALQNDIARAIAGEIRLQLSPAAQGDLSRSRALIPAAQEAYLRGRYHFNQGDETATRKSIEDFTEAISLDPKDPRSHAGLSQAHIALTDFYERPTETMPAARKAAEDALALDPRFSDAHTALGAVRFLYDWDFRAAEAEFTRALELNPASADAHVWYGIFLAQMGRFDQAIGEMRRANSLDPLSVPVHINAGWVFYLARQGDQAIGEWKKALALEPNLGVAHTSIWLAYAQRGQSWPGVTDGRADVSESSPLNMATVAGAYAMSGQRTAAEAVLSRLASLADHRYVCAYEIATAHAALQQDDQAIGWLRKGLEQRSVCMPDLKVDPRFDRLRSDPRFVQLLREIGFDVSR